MKKRIDIEDLLFWTYGRQKAHLVLGFPNDDDGNAMRMGRLPGSWEAVTSMARLGTRVDGGGVSLEIHNDAASVHDAVLRLAEPHRSLLLQYGIRGTPPCWRAEVEMMPVLTDAGRIRMLYDPRSRKPIACAVEAVVDAEEVRMSRELYASWRRALSRLAAALRPHTLDRWQIIGPAAPEEPWCEKDVDFAPIT